MLHRFPTSAITRCLTALLLLNVTLAQAQTTYVPLWAKEGWLLDRLEIKAQTNNALNLSTVKPYMRRAYVAVADSFRELLLQGKNPAKLSEIDQYNLDRFQANNSEYSRFTESQMPSWKSKNEFLGFLWPSKGNMLEVNEKDFYLSVNPAINQQQSLESDFDRRVFVNAKGLTVRGLIADKIGFHFMATDNQEQGTLPFRQFVAANRQVPGAGFWKDFKGDRGFDYFDARGSVSWQVTKMVNMQFGYDQHFIGAGYRSLFLSNFGPPALFLKVNTRVGKFNYTNLFTEMFPRSQLTGDKLLPRKYLAMHHLSFNATPWLTVGAFESMVFGRPDKLEAAHLQPVIFLNTLARQRNGFNSANIGLDAKANLLQQAQVYGQWRLGGLPREGSTGANGWNRQHAWQFGAKYVDVAGIQNLDLQVEYNVVRPFMYAHRDTVASFTNYRQPLAHPMGANLREWIGVLRFQPFERLYITGRANYWQQGLDSAGFNFGSNPNRLDVTRPRDNGFPLLAGDATKGVNMALLASYELRENLFIEGQGLIRRFSRAGQETVNTTVVTLGIRWNWFRRDYDY